MQTQMYFQEDDLFTNLCGIVSGTLNESTDIKLHCSALHVPTFMLPANNDVNYKLYFFCTNTRFVL